MLDSKSKKNLPLLWLGIGVSGISANEYFAALTTFMYITVPGEVYTEEMP